ncbi:DotD/TraH family lipoprotein [Piscirickettsia litoralis]|uniref:Type IV secretion protein DotD n=1 Tax=Piscirickettsia litoralis TaxID=1891921 RepID=A0ABX3A0T0_9GAMM|nr:DotD/TraH family lipoprotein [Piscirickettsia litoralis]ODN42462.1 hypothetical protein BGC07_05375 [Piscirickettsia litoralis]
MNYLLIFSFLLLLSGCASNQIQEEKQVEQSANKQKQANLKLVQALQSSVEEVSLAMKQLAIIKSSQYPYKNNLPFSDIAGRNPFNKKITVNWYGPASNILKSIAKELGYQYQVFGKDSKLPVLVNINYLNTPVITVLRNIDFQLNKKAQIKIIPDSKIIALRYINND